MKTVFPTKFDCEHLRVFTLISRNCLKLAYIILLILVDFSFYFMRNVFFYTRSVLMSFCVAVSVVHGSLNDDYLQKPIHWAVTGIYGDQVRAIMERW